MRGDPLQPTTWLQTCLNLAQSPIVLREIWNVVFNLFALSWSPIWKILPYLTPACTSMCFSSLAWGCLENQHTRYFSVSELCFLTSTPVPIMCLNLSGLQHWCVSSFSHVLTNVKCHSEKRTLFLLPLQLLPIKQEPWIKKDHTYPTPPLHAFIHFYTEGWMQDLCIELPPQPFIVLFWNKISLSF